MSTHAAIGPEPLDAYFRRIGYAGPRTASLDALRAIHLRHVTAIAFENLTPFCRQPVLLDTPSLLHKLVHSGRGGYCFEHNLLLRSVLLALGFEVTALAARVRWNVPDDAIVPRTHMLLRVDLAGDVHLVDAGFGGLTLTAPLRLAPDTIQATPHEPFRILQAGGEYVLQAQIQEQWKTLYTFDLQAQRIPDYEVVSWYLSTHPQSRFVTSLIAARADPDKRYALLNDQLSIHHLRGGTERHTLSSAAELREVLEYAFRLSLADIPGVDAALQRAIRPHTP